MTAPPGTSRRPERPDDEEIVEQIVKAISSVRYGHVQIVIQDSRVVRIDETEKVRLT